MLHFPSVGTQMPEPRSQSEATVMGFRFDLLFEFLTDNVQIIALIKKNTN